MKKKSSLIKRILVALPVMALFSCGGTKEPANTIRFYAGSSNAKLSHSIYLCELDPVKEALAVLDSFAGARAASYLDLSPDEEYLFAINQDPLGQQPDYCSVTSFSVAPGTLHLKLINSQSSEGSDICHIYCSEKGDYIFAANYGSGHATALPVGENGEISPATSVVIGSGSGPVQGRQEGPHAHQVILDPGQHFLLVPDLGTDRVMIFAFDPESGILTPNPAQPYFQLAPGAGPRHLVFHPDGQSLYIVNELNATLTACSYRAVDGTITELNTLSTVEASHSGMKYPAEVRVHPNGKFVYASTRGENSCITAFKINKDRTADRIQVVEQVPNWPRDFNLDPSGRWMLVAGERSNQIRLYTINPDNGMLKATECTVKLPAPASVLFVK
jgi:6-phosphogluconolactonase